MNTITMIRSNQPATDLQLGHESRTVRLPDMIEWSPRTQPVRTQIRVKYVWTEGRYQEAILVLPVKSNQ